MTYLLDTNAWLRFIQAPELLSASARAVLFRAVDAPFALSAFSVWEIGTKARKGKLALTQPFAAWLQAALPPRLLRVLPVDVEVARLSQELPGSFHEDPADRIITATAIRHDLTLITSDGKILDYPHVRTLW